MAYISLYLYIFVAALRNVKQENSRMKHKRNFMNRDTSLTAIIAAALLEDSCHYVIRLFAAASFLMVSGSIWGQNDSLASDQRVALQPVKKNQLGFSMNLLTHGEICSGGLPRNANASPGEDHSRFLSGRLRLNVDYQRSGLQAHATLQNSAIWGSKSSNSLTLYEGWAKITAKFGLFAQVGRIALAYDDERIIGPNDFATASKSHDLVRVGYEGHGHQVHALLAFNQNGPYNGTYYEDGSQLYKSMQTLWYHYDVPKVPLGASLLFMNIGQQAGVQGDAYNPPSTQYQQMYGAYVKYHPRYLTLEASYYRQSGKVVNEFQQTGSIKAWMASVRASVRPFDKFGFLLGYDYLSGDDYVPVIHGGTLGLARHETVKGFTPLYGSRTKFYGLLDYFYESAYINGFTPGLQNLFAGGQFYHKGKFMCSATYHYLATAAALPDLGRTLGHSVELQASYQFTKDILLVAGYTQMHGTETMNRLKQGSSTGRALWGWFSLVVSPTLFTAKF